MNPGLRDTLIEVWKREKEEEDFGTAVNKTLLGKFWASVTNVTKSLVYSGNEMFRPQALWPVPVVRFTFGLDYEFDYASTEFHLEGQIYCPREPGVRLVRARGSIVIYNCSRQIPGEKVVEPLPPLPPGEF